MRTFRLVFASLCLAGLVLTLAAGLAGDQAPFLEADGRRTVHHVGPMGPLTPGVLLTYYEGHCPKFRLFQTDWLGRDGDGLAALWHNPRLEPALESRISAAFILVDRLWPAAEPWAGLPGQESARGFAMEVEFAPFSLGPDSVYLELRGIGYIIDLAAAVPIALHAGYSVVGGYCL